MINNNNKNIYMKLMEVQSELKAPKGQRNNFGNYNYRNCEDILEAVKPILKDKGLALIMNDEVIDISGRFYVKSTARLINIDNGEMIETSALAREDETKKGMDLAQITGACSSYSRKYALNGLFAIDNSELDPDKTNTHGKEETRTTVANTTILSDKQVNRLLAIGKAVGQSGDMIKKVAKKDYNVDELNKLSKGDYEALCNRLEKLRK